MGNECLLDADRPTIHIKTDQVIPNKTWSRIVYWIKKNVFFSTSVCIAFIMTLYLIQISQSSTSETMFQALRERLDASLYYPPHQNKIRAYPSFEYPDPDYYLNTSNVIVKGALVILAREEEVYRVHLTMLDLERHFNHQYGYPWVIIGHKVFSRHFREFITSTTKAPVSFGLAPSIEFQEPYWIDIRYAEDRAKAMSKMDLNKGESMHFRRMTRYNAGFIAFHPLLKNLDYYWKVQPGSRYHCDITGDPFKKMKDEGKKFSFALTSTENHLHVEGFETIVKKYITENKNSLVPVKNSIYRALLNDVGMLTSKNGNEPILGEFGGHWSNCMIANNFMIMSLDFLRSKEYNRFFDMLDASGGFFYQRWGDSFPQTVAASLFLKKNEIQYNDIEGYSYGGGTVCPSDLNKYVNLRCTCDPKDRGVRYQNFCTPKFVTAIDGHL